MSVLRENIRTCIFFLGLGLALTGVAQWSGPMALVTAGAVLMGASLAPYVRRKG